MIIQNKLTDEEMEELAGAGMALMFAAQIFEVHARRALGSGSFLAQNASNVRELVDQTVSGLKYVKGNGNV